MASFVKGESSSSSHKEEEIGGKKHHEEPVSEIPFATLGLRLRAIEDFVTSCGGEKAFSSGGSAGWIPSPLGDNTFIHDSAPDPKKALTTDDVNTKFQKPLSSSLETSYCELLQQQGSPDVGEATVFISHAWKYEFLSVLQVLRYYFQDEAETFIYFDLFSNNQHAAPNLPFEWWRDTFMGAIRRMNRVVQILSPWDKPLPFTRAWCLWEIYCAVATNSRFDVAVTPDQQNAFIETIVDDPDKYFTMLAGINVENSEASKVSDRENIFDAVKSSVGFDALNSMVSGKMRDWVLQVLDVSIADSERESQSESKADSSIMNTSSSSSIVTGIQRTWDRKRAKAIMLEKMSRYEESQAILQQCLIDFKDVSHADVRWGRTFDGIASVYWNQGKFECAQEYYEKALAAKLTCLGPQNTEVADALNGIGWCFHSLENYEGALEYFENALQTLLLCLGPDHSSVAVTYSNIGEVYYEQKNHEKALEYHEKALSIDLNSLGAYHSYVAIDYTNIASVYADQKEYSKALEYHEKSLHINLIALGKEHSIVGTAYHDIGFVFERQEAFSKALEYYEKSLHIRLNSLGEAHPDTVHVINSVNALRKRDNKNNCRSYSNSGI